MMEPLNIYALKQTAMNMLLPHKRSAGRIAVWYFLVAGLLRFLVSYLSNLLIQIPEFSSAEELIRYYTTDNISSLLLMLLFNMISMLLIVLFAAVFSAYCLNIAKGAAVAPRTLLRCLKTVPRYIVLFVLAVLILFVVCYLVSFIAMFAASFFMLFFIVLLVFAIIAFYALRLILFAIADRNDFRIFEALKSCIKQSQGHKKELFILDFSFLWYFVLISLISSIISSLPQIAAIAAANFNSLSLVVWIAENADLLYIICSVLGLFAVMPLYYKHQTHIQLTYALVYQVLKDLTPPQKETQPLAYQEFDNPSV